MLSDAGEKLWGLGERMTDQLNNKGLLIDFKADQKNTHITIPFLMSSRKYGCFWCVPALPALACVARAACPADVWCCLGTTLAGAFST